MYYPYFRGKQNELILIREQAELISNSKIIPIIEPVKRNLSPLNRAIEQLDLFETEYILIVNPINGDFANNNSLILKNLHLYKKVIIGLIITAETTLNNIEDYLSNFNDYKIAILHQGFTDGKGLVNLIGNNMNVCKNIFVNTEQNKLYQKHFKSIGDRILIRDAFKKTTNAHYAPEEHFSDLHITYDDENMDGFGDFLIVGDEYSETGGPARAIAIHLTFLKEEDDNNMYIKHYVSDRTEGVSDPGGKFLEALYKLVSDIDKNPLKFNTNACNEYRKLLENEHFPGLGVAKKLSMQHHIEIIARFLG